MGFVPIYQLYEKVTAPIDFSGEKMYNSVVMR